jgi:hypothetical protein
MSDSPLLGLPYLAASQAQKHVTHNEALSMLDGLVHLAVASRALAAPPPSPADGARYLIAASPTGDWAGHEGQMALRMEGVWAFFTPREGWRLWVADEDTLITFDGTSWNGVGGVVIKTQLFTVSGTYTPDAKLIYAQVFATGGGGGGGGADCSNANTNIGVGGGGGGGATAIKILSAAAIGASQAVTIGAGGAAGDNAGGNGGMGGNTTFGSILTSQGGGGGSGGTGIASVSASQGGAGALASGGDINVAGGGGGNGMGLNMGSSVVGTGGGGGTTYWGSGGRAGVISSAGSSGGSTPGVYGGGGAGSVTNQTTGQAGAAGQAGVVYIIEYCGQ